MTCEVELKSKTFQENHPHVFQLLEKTPSSNQLENSLADLIYGVLVAVFLIFLVNVERLEFKEEFYGSERGIYDVLDATFKSGPALPGAVPFSRLEHIEVPGYHLEARGSYEGFKECWIYEDQDVQYTGLLCHFSVLKKVRVDHLMFIHCGGVGDGAQAKPQQLVTMLLASVEELELTCDLIPECTAEKLFAGL